VELEDLISAIKDIPYMPPRRGREIYAFVREHQPESVLELGFAHGTSSCYIGSALKANGSGVLLTIDHDRAREREPDIHTLLDRTGLCDWVQPLYTPTSYTWELMRLIEDTPVGEWRFDFAFIDGAHTWFVDGFAFYLVDRLLKPGGWILFDDLNWTYAISPTLRDTDFVKALPEEERYTPQIGKVFDLLVRPHPQYDHFRVDKSWGWAQKKSR
jgi:predicted O-methyltransferase YrrM